MRLLQHMFCVILYVVSIKSRTEFFVDVICLSGSFSLYDR